MLSLKNPLLGLANDKCGGGIRLFVAVRVMARTGHRLDDYIIQVICVGIEINNTRGAGGWDIGIWTLKMVMEMDVAVIWIS